MSKHLLLYTDDPGLGGVAQYNDAILNGLVALGYQVSCVQSKSDNPLVSSQKELGIQHVWLDFDTSREFGRTLTYQADAQNILTTYKPDFIIFSDCCPFSNFAAKQVAIALEIPYIVVIGFVAPYLAERFTAYLNELSYQYSQAQAVIAVSNENLSLLHELFRLPNSKGQVIYYGRAEQYFTPPVLSVREHLRQQFDIPLDAVVCFTSARLEAVKGYQYQLEAIKQLKQTEAWNQLYFVWAGAGSLEAQLKEAIEQLGVSSQVKLLGHRWDIQNWLDASDIFILPSELEGMPLCIMEAMAKGLPVIASAVSGIPEELDNTGKLLTDPKVEPQATITELVTTIQTWSINPELRQLVGLACKKRAEEMFKEERMVKETMEAIGRALLPDGDYVSPGFSIVLPDKCFPNMIVGDTSACPWPYLRREVPHNWYVDKRQPTVGFLSRDEAHILYNTALKFKGKKALEIGCWLGWSACHLALAGVELDIVDPLLGRVEFYESVSNSLKTSGVLDSVNLIPGFSPQKVEEIASQLQRKWSLIFIDGNHDAPYPLNDAIACEQFAESDALILFHDLASPDVAQGLDYLRQRGWNTMVYQTMQIMGIAWRGNVETVKHYSDSSVKWALPNHLLDYPVSPDFEEKCKPNELPLVSIIIPCYNQAHFLPEAVASVVAQTYENWEIIIVNDGSLDNTSEVAEKLISAYANKKIQLINKNNGGPASARNAGIAIATGEYILPLDADDKLNSTAIFLLMDIALKQISPCVVFGSYQMFGFETKTVISADLYSDENLLRFNMLHPSSLYSVEAWKILNGYKEDFALIGYEDWEFWINCYKHSIPFYRIKEVVVHYRISYESTGKKARRDHRNKIQAIAYYHSELFTPDIIKESEKLLCYFGLFKELAVPKDELKQFLDQISNRIDQYLKEANNEAALTSLRQVRQQFVDRLLSLSTEQLVNDIFDYIGKVHQALLNSGIKNESLTETEQIFVNELSGYVSKEFNEPKGIQYLLAAMLYCRADQLPLQYNLTHIPQWLLDDYLKFIFEFPRLFQKTGEADNYYHYLQQWLDYLQANISSNQGSALWQYIAKFFLQAANFIPLYFTTRNLKYIYTKRANIMEYALKNQGYQIDYGFPERSSERKKIRLGVLAAHFGPQTETFTTLPAYKHLNRDLFEIILYATSASNHRLERYCWGHADAFITLPQDLPSQVQTIRDGDLDIILVATNVTAVINSITLLALHRLARVQVASTSSCVTTGMCHVDYYISGQLTESTDNAQAHYTEKLITVEGPAHCHDFATEEQLVSTIDVSRESLRIEPNEVVYISGANFYKIIPEVETAWAKIIATVPNSKLVLYPFNPNWSSSYPVNYFKKRILATFSSYGLSEDRLLILEPVPNRADVKERLKIADVYLDSYPFSGSNSLIEPLEIGLPTTVMDGNSFRSLMGAALLQELQIPDLIADSEESYIQLAIALGSNPELRQQKSAQIKERMQANPRFLDSRSYSAQMGEIFQKLFYKYQAETLTENFKLRETNLIIFPDWNQPEEVLYQDLASVITGLVNHPDKTQTTLLIHQGNLVEEEANLLLADITMNLLLEEDLDASDDPEISLVGQISEMQGEALIQRLQARIVLEHENKEAITQLQVETIPSYDLDSFNLLSYSWLTEKTQEPKL